MLIRKLHQSPTQYLQLTTRFLIFLKTFIHRLKVKKFSCLKNCNTAVLVYQSKHSCSAFEKAEKLSLLNHRGNNFTLKYVILITVLLYESSSSLHWGIVWRPPSACLPSSDPCQTLRTEAPQECSSSHCSRSRSGTLFPTLTTALSVCYNRKWKNATVFLTMRNGVDLSKFVQNQFSSHIKPIWIWLYKDNSCIWAKTDK